MTRGKALVGVVLTHLAINTAHGRSHAGAGVALPLPSALFVYLVILAGPLAGLGVTRWRPRAGAWIVAVTMSGALIFGLINHFMLAGPDHVSHVAPEWRAWFGVTAALLIASEAAGAAIGAWAAMRTSGRTS
jgi:hypothetical protein